MAEAATCYLLAQNNDADTCLWLWPWAPECFKPGDHKRNLVKAGALIAAELDRLLRLEQVESNKPNA